MTDSDGDTRLAFVTPAGDEIEWSVRHDVTRPDGPVPDGVGIVAHRLLLNAGQHRVLRRRLRRGPDRRRNDTLERLLDMEIAAGLRLVRRFEDSFPPALPRLLGYRVDIDEPYALWLPAEGTPLAEIGGTLDNDSIDSVLRQLLTALAHLAAAEVAHRGLTPRTVRWTGESVVIDGLSTAALTGVPRVPLGDEPWASPEQARGIGKVDPRDDVWSVAVLLGHLIDHRNPSPRARLGPRYSALLGEALAARAGQRPTAVELLTTLSWAAPATVAAPTLDRRSLAARAQFDRAAPDERPEWIAPVPAGEPAPSDQRVGAQSPPRPGTRRSRWWSGGGRRPTPPPSRPHRECYLCLDPVEWAETDLFTWANGQYEPLDAQALGSGRRREDRLRQAFRRCPNPSGDAPPHYLPAAYLRTGPPVNIGLIGDTGAGKTHLLAGIMREIEAGALHGFGITTGAVDIAWHDEFRRTRVERLFRDHQVLEHTQPVDEVDFADGLIISTGTAQRPLMFFDIAGEMLAQMHLRKRATQFLAAVDALLFVADPTREEPDPTFSTVLDRLSHRQDASGKLDVPAAIVVTKSDLLRFEEPVDRWIGLPGPEHRRLWPEHIRAESRDAYTYLHSRGRIAQLSPYERCRRCTLHFASATGGGETNGVFTRGARPQRCVQPLLSLLTMTGVLSAPGHNGDGGQ